MRDLRRGDIQRTGNAPRMRRAAATFRRQGPVQRWPECQGRLVISVDVLALFDEEAEPAVLARCSFYVPAPSRDGTSAGREQAGGVILHKPVAAVLLPSDLLPLSRR